MASVIAMVSALCPEQLEVTTKLAFRAYIGGIVTCFISASLAGILKLYRMSSLFFKKMLSWWYYTYAIRL